MVVEKVKKSETIPSTIINLDLGKLMAPIWNLNLNPTLQAFAKLNENLNLKMAPFLNFSRIYQGYFSKFNEIMKNIDWEKFERRYRISMIEEFSKIKDERVTAILGQVLSEFWLNIFIKTLFSNSKQIQVMSFDNKRKILLGLGIINSGLSSDLKYLDDIRAEYAHNFIVKKENILKFLRKINRYNNLVKSNRIVKRNANNVRIRETAKKIIFDLMEIEEKYVIEVQKISKEQKRKKDSRIKNS